GLQQPHPAWRNLSVPLPDACEEAAQENGRTTGQTRHYGVQRCWRANTSNGPEGQVSRDASGHRPHLTHGSGPNSAGLYGSTTQIGPHHGVGYGGGDPRSDPTATAHPCKARNLTKC